MNRLELKQVLKKATRAVKDGFHSGANSLLLQVKSGTLTISARNPIWAIRAWADIADGEKELSCIVDASLFNKVVDKMTGDNIKLSISKGCLVIQSGKTKANIPYQDDKKWPKSQSFKPLHRLDISEKALNCSHALAKSEARNGLLSSYHVEVFEDGYCLTATDSKRISVCCFGSGKLKYDFAIDGEFLKEAVTLSGGEAFLETDTENVLVVGNDVELYAKTRPERYPNIQSLLASKKSTTAITVNRKDFLEALMVTTLMDNVIVIDISEQNVIMSNKPSVKGDSHTELPAVVEGKSNLRIGLEGAYMKDAIQALKGEKITLHFEHAKAPVYLEEGPQTELILPVIIRE